MQQMGRQEPAGTFQGDGVGGREQDWSPGRHVPRGWPLCPISSVLVCRDRVCERSVLGVGHCLGAWGTASDCVSIRNSVGGWVVRSQECSAHEWQPTGTLPCWGRSHRYGGSRASMGDLENMLGTAKIQMAIKPHQNLVRQKLTACQ